MSWRDYEKNIQEYGIIIDKPIKPRAFIAHLKDKLATACEDADLIFRRTD
jgi:hypothetical protein